MVNYQGPKLIKYLIDKWEIPIFNRVEKVDFVLNDANAIPIDKDDLATFRELEHYRVSKKGKIGLSESEMKAVEKTLPTCLLASAKKTDNEISVEVDPKVGFLCGCK